MSNLDTPRLDSHEDFHVGEENKDDAVQEVEVVEDASLNDDSVQQSSNKRKQGQEPSHVWKHFSKVKEFKKLDEAILDALCDRVKMTFYFKHTHISLEGDPIYEMLFLVQGKIWIYSSKERISGSANTDYFRDDNNNMSKRDHPADGDF